MPKVGSRRKGKTTQAETEARPKEMERRKVGGGGAIIVWLDIQSSQKVKNEIMIMFDLVIFF